ncbi:MAG: hypothetical protein Q7T18_01845, partial [Sedimentisphaerales bacterium]|nr:hypothetical protein [Sedimentisphaerales bacterium]
DFTAFVYGDKDGFWPGYILKLKAGESPLLLASGVVKIETDTALIYSFFAQAPGIASPAFRDAQLSGNPVRELTFTQKPSAFIYGWVKSQYLIIGTSEEAVKSAISRL